MSNLTPTELYILRGIANHRFAAFIVGGIELVNSEPGGHHLRDLAAQGLLRRYMDTINYQGDRVAVDVFDITETGRAALKEKE